MKIEHFIRYTELAVGLMEIENLIRYAPLAVGLKPSASQGEARLRGTRTPTVTYRPSAIGYRLCTAKPACAGQTVLNSENSFLHSWRLD